MMETLLIILGFVCIVAGIAGSVLPILPGLPLSYAGILFLQFTQRVQFSMQFLILWALLIILIQLLDYFIPVWGIKKFGGSKRGIWGCMIGMIFGLISGPWLILAGPFIGSVIGELINGKNFRMAIRAGFGSFLGFLAGTIVKLVAGVFLLYFAIAAVIS